MPKPPIVPVLEALHPDFREMGLRTWGAWTSVRCAFHGDRHASASYNPDEGVFVCHVCDIAGDAYEVVKEVERVDFPTAKQRVQSIIGDSGIALSGSSLEHSSGGRRSRLLEPKGTAAERRQRLSSRSRRRRIA